MAILLHYFTLASLMWMAVEAVNMYMLFVRVWDSHIHLFLVKASIIAWGKSIKELMIENVIDDLHISHNASGMEANIRVLLIRNSSSHSSLVVSGLELLCLAATLCLYRTRGNYQGYSLMRS